MSPKAKDRIAYWTSDIFRTAMCIIAGIKIAEWLKL